MSCERRMERFIILYTFKIIRKEVDDPGTFTIKYTIKRGLLLRSTLKMTGSQGLKTVIGGSFGTKAVQLFNSDVPDMPRGKSGLNLPQAVIPGLGIRSNSLTH